MRKNKNFVQILFLIFVGIVIINFIFSPLFYLIIVFLSISVLISLLFKKILGPVKKHPNTPIETVLSSPFSNTIFAFIILVFFITIVVLGFKFQEVVDKEEAEKMFPYVVLTVTFMLSFFGLNLIIDIRNFIANKKIAEFIKVIKGIDLKKGVIKFEEDVSCEVGFLEIYSYGQSEGILTFIQLEPQAIERKSIAYISKDYFLIYSSNYLYYSIFPAIKGKGKFKNILLVVIPEMNLEKTEEYFHKCKDNNCIEGKVVITHRYVKPIEILIAICGIKIPSFAGNLAKFGKIEIKLD